MVSLLKSSRNKDSRHSDSKTMRRALKACTLFTLFTGAGAFVAPVTPRYRPQACQIRALDEAESPKVTMEGIQKFRERQRLKGKGAPLHEWSHGADRADTFKPTAAQDPYTPGQDGYTPPTEQQKAAADALFEKVLSDKVPEGFAEGIEGCEAAPVAVGTRAEPDMFGVPPGGYTWGGVF